MSEWVGMHNPERHHPYGGRIICDWCSEIVGGGPCYDDLPCRCCLEAEVERLTEGQQQSLDRIQRVRELHHPSQSTIWSHDLQQAITVTTCQHCGSDPYPCPTIKALDGGSDE